MVETKKEPCSIHQSWATENVKMISSKFCFLLLRWILVQVYFKGLKNTDATVRGYRVIEDRALK